MPKDDQTGWVEPDITINGRMLSFAEAMAVRVAVSSFRMFLSEPTHRAQLGPVAGGYDAHLGAVEAMMRNRG